MALCGMLSGPILEFAGSIASAKPIRRQGSLEELEFRIVSQVGRQRHVRLPSAACLGPDPGERLWRLALLL